MEEFKLPDGTPMFHMHRGECVFLYEEIFTRRCYAGAGLSLDPRSTGCIFDVGANIGMAALFFHRECPKKKIYAFEPSPKTFAVLSANVARLGIDAKLYDCALSSAPGTATFSHYPGKSTMSGLFADPEAEKRTTKAYMMNEGVKATDADFLLRKSFQPELTDCLLRTVSEIIAENQVVKVELLKIDVEKAELDVLRGVSDAHWPLIEQVVVEVHDVDGRLALVMEMLEGRGFKLNVRQDPKLKDTGLYDLVAVRAA